MCVLSIHNLTFVIICSIIVFVLFKKYKKGECLFILNRKILYYTKELVKVLKVAIIALVGVTTIILIKYTPQYEVSIDGKQIGYVKSQSDIDKYIDEKVQKEEGKNIAFVDLKNTPEFKLELVSRSIENNETILKEEIAKQVSIEYTNYAISIDGKNKTYVASMDEAQKIVDELKKEYAKKYTKKLGILQVYSDNYEEISSVSTKKAKSVVSSELKKVKKADDVRIAKANAKAAAAASKVTKVAKASNVNGVKFTVRPVTGTITSRFGRRSSPGGIGSTNHKGLDIAAPNGTLIYAAAGGTVEFSGYKGSLGKLVIINHGSGVKTYYAHCSSLKVSAGQTVEAGKTIASVGKSGTATGYHLHFEVRVNGSSVNPQNYIY